jgi:hypothetical protein
MQENKINNQKSVCSQREDGDTAADKKDHKSNDDRHYTDTRI